MWACRKKKNLDGVLAHGNWSLESRVLNVPIYGHIGFLTGHDQYIWHEGECAQIVRTLEPVGYSTDAYSNIYIYTFITVIHYIIRIKMSNDNMLQHSGERETLFLKKRRSSKKR